jgi:hypothetical protein
VQGAKANCLLILSDTHRSYVRDPSEFAALTFVKDDPVSAPSGHSGYGQASDSFLDSLSLNTGDHFKLVAPYHSLANTRPPITANCHWQSLCGPSRRPIVPGYGVIDHNRHQIFGNDK